MTAVLKAPFPWMGGKSSIADYVWQRFGDVPNYVEPFAGSAAVLLRRPPFEGNRIEAINDADGNLSNFWRALQADPEAGRDMGIYSVDSGDVAHAAREWAIANGDNPLMRIALCGYAGEGHDHLADLGWHAWTWKAHGGYGSQGNGTGRANAKREVVWFSPHCLHEYELLPIFR